MALEIGQKFRCDMVVTEKDVAAMAESNSFNVLATPRMIMLMEESCSFSLLPHLEEGYASVGIHVDVYHTAATPIGKKVWAESEITEIDGRKVTFKLTAYDENGEIGFGTHERFIINVERFIKKHEGKA